MLCLFGRLSVAYIVAYNNRIRPTAFSQILHIYTERYCYNYSQTIDSLGHIRACSGATAEAFRVDGIGGIGGGIVRNTL